MRPYRTDPNGRRHFRRHLPRTTTEAECRAQMARLLAWAHSARMSAMGCPWPLSADYKGTARRMLQEAETLRRGLADHLALTRATPTLP